MTYPSALPRGRQGGDCEGDFWRVAATGGLVCSSDEEDGREERRPGRWWVFLAPVTLGTGDWLGRNVVELGQVAHGLVFTCAAQTRPGRMITESMAWREWAGLWGSSALSPSMSVTSCWVEASVHSYVFFLMKHGPFFKKKFLFMGLCPLLVVMHRIFSCSV